MSTGTQKQEEWIIEKKINLGDVLTVASMFTTMLIFIGTGWVHLQNRIDTVSARVAINEEISRGLKEEVKRDREISRTQFSEILTEIRLLRREISEKADK